MKVAVISNTSWYIYNFRKNLIESLIKNNHILYCFTPKDEYSNKLNILGLNHKNWYLNQISQNILTEVFSILHLCILVKKNKIDLILSFTPKGNLYSLISSCFSTVKVICNISGLGEKFKNRSVFSRLLMFVLKKMSKNAHAVFFQNKEDMLFLNGPNNTNVNNHLIPGSGVDLNKFFTKGKISTSKYFFSFIGRLLKEKGVYVYIEAIKLIKKDYPHIQCSLVGFIDDKRKNSVNLKEIQAWEEQGLISFLSSTDDVKSILEQTESLVLPSYYNEGVPRSLLEASAMSLPIITTNHSGCRDAVDDGLTGFLCEKKNANDLAKKMIKMIKMTPEERKTMGKLGRAKMENEFDEKIVIDKYLKVINSY